MQIDNNELERRAAEVFRAGDRELALKIQDEFLAEFREHYQDKDHCPCKRACKLHGNCKECVAVHRAHMEHLPVCFFNLVNDRLKSLSEITEHTLPQVLQSDS